MKTVLSWRLLFPVLSTLALSAMAGGPIRLHPDNPHYFLWQDKPAILITSAEHYGAVLNLDFDFRKYLDTFAAEGMNNTRTLDYSFTAGHEDGTFAYPASQPGGGNAGFRRQMRILREFIHGFDFIHMRPDNSILAGAAPARVLANPRKEIAVYIGKAGVKDLELNLPAGSWMEEWVDTKTGQSRPGGLIVGGGKVKLTVPPYDTDIALRLQRRSP